MMRTLFSVAVGALVLAASPASADDGVVVSTTVQPTFRQGKLNGCETIFSVVHRDAEYFGNDPVFLSGSILITAADGMAPAMMIKLGVAKTEGAAAMQFQAPTDAYLVSGLKTNVADKFARAEAETPGHALFVYRLDRDSLDALTPLLSDGKLTVAYAMRNGSSGSRFVVDATVADTMDGKEVRDGAAVGRLQECFWALMKPYLDQATSGPRN